MKELKSLASIDYAYKNSYKIAIICILGVIIIALGYGYWYTQTIDNIVKNKLVIVTSDYGSKTLNSKEEIVKFHVITFHKLMYQVDQFNYANSIRQSLYLIDFKEGKNIVNEYKSNDWFKLIVGNNLVIGVDIDSVKVEVIDKKDLTYGVLFYGKQLIRTRDNVDVRNLNSAMKVHPVNNSELNPLGYMIYDYNLYDNSQIKIRKIGEDADKN